MTIALTGTLCTLSSLVLAAETISISDAWARASIGKARAGAAFVTMNNNGKSGDRVISASADVSRKVELHTHIRQDDVMMMRKVDGVDIPAGNKVVLKPGGYHIMLIGLKAPLKSGESFPLSLTFEKAGTIQTTVSVQKTASMKMEQ